MAVRTANELRLSAENLRQMAIEGDDVRLQAALRLVADEFEQEAAKTEVAAPPAAPEAASASKCKERFEVLSRTSIGPGVSPTG